MLNFVFMKQSPIGVFDSGYGGLTVLKAITALLPQYDYIYLGDNARAPYGPRSFDKVYEYTLEAVQWFFEQGCELVILACNTASAKALRTIQQNDLEKIASGKRVLGVIRPTAEVIGNFTDTKHVGVLGTRGTVNSASYLIEIEKFFPGLTVSQEACPMWVPLVENNEHQGPGADYFIQQHLDHILSLDPKIDCLLLACTHYPLLLDKIRSHIPGSIKIIEQGNIVAEGLKDYLHRHPEIETRCSKNGHCSFYTTGDTADFDEHGAAFFGRPVNAVKIQL